MARKLLGIAAVVCAAAPAQATTLVGLDLPELSRLSDVVVHGKVASVQAHWTGDHQRIVTEVQVEVTEAFKGQAGKTVLIDQPGGVVGDIGQLVQGVAAFTAGEEVVVFLGRRPGERFMLTGMGQGKFRVARSTDGKAAFAVPEDLGGALVVDPATHRPLPDRPAALTLQSLRAQVRASAATPKP